MNELHRHLRDYLALRRAMGFRLERHGKLLAQFLDHLAAAQIPTTALTVESALAWACAPGSADMRWWAARLSVVRGFAAYLHAIDAVHQIPPRGLLPTPARHRRIVPHLYSDQDIDALIAAAGRLSFPLRAATYQVLIGLLAVTGMRVGEAIRLDRGDFDATDGIVRVRDSKFGKSRDLPLHASATARLNGYLRLRDQVCPHPATAALLLSTRGHRLRYQRLWETFARLRDQAGLRPASAQGGPRIHDLRHSFAVTTLLGWYRQGADVPALLPRLSTYLGHADPRHTYWYLSAAPELLTLAAARLDAHQAEQTHQGRTEAKLP